MRIQNFFFISMVFNMFLNFPEDDLFRVQQDNG